MSIINVRNMPDDLHREAKAAAATEGKTLQDWFIEAVKEKLERNKESK
jgi:plasmid stability protein